MLSWDTEHNQQKVLDIFLKEMHLLSDQRYWELMRTVWVISGSLETVDIFKKLMRSDRGYRYYFSTPEESEKLREFPDTMEIHRALNGETDEGISWTLSYEYAEKYQKMFDKERIITRTIAKEQIFAFIERNNESEILILV